MPLQRTKPPWQDIGQPLELTAVVHSYGGMLLYSLVGYCCTHWWDTVYSLVGYSVHAAPPRDWLLAGDCKQCCWLQKHVGFPMRSCQQQQWHAGGQGCV